jgi:hypothetical protein
MSEDGEKGPWSRLVSTEAGNTVIVHKEMLLIICLEIAVMRLMKADQDDHHFTG